MQRTGAQLPVDSSRLFAQHRDGVRLQLARLVPSADVEDVLQDVFTKAARALPQFRGDAAVATWLHRIALRAAFDHLRSRRHREQQRTVPLEDEQTKPPCACGCVGRPAANPTIPAEAPHRLVQAEMCDCIREFVGRLSPDHAEVLRLKELEDLTNPEISARLGISLAAAKIRVHRARAALRALVDTDCELYRTGENTLACDRKQPSPSR